MPGATVTIDLPSQTVTGPDGVAHRFEIDPFRKQALLEGLDDIGLTLRHDSAIEAFEASPRRGVALGGPGPLERLTVAANPETAAGCDRAEATRGQVVRSDRTEEVAR